MIELDLVADFYRRYPGEIVTLHVRTKVVNTLTGIFYLTITLPAGLEPLEYNYPAPDMLYASMFPRYEIDSRTQMIRLVWKYEGEFVEGNTQNYQIKIKVLPLEFRWSDECQATLVGYDGETKLFEQNAFVLVDVPSKAKILKMLPSIYHNDVILARFLMFFESFWQPVDDRLKQIAYYFDPLLAPPDFLPWLASWVSLLLDEGLPEERQRELIKETAASYLRRGTRSALQKRLQICLGIPVDEASNYIQIHENQAGNFYLHDETELSDELVLGTADDIYKFTVAISWPPGVTPLPRHVIEKFIEVEKPAHTSYTLLMP